jgi:hypothetical protein
LFGQVGALLLDISMRPSEHLDDAALLSVLVNVSLVD